MVCRRISWNGKVDHKSHNKMDQYQLSNSPGHNSVSNQPTERPTCHPRLCKATKRVVMRTSFGKLNSYIKKFQFSFSDNKTLNWSTFILSKFTINPVEHHDCQQHSLIAYHHHYYFFSILMTVMTNNHFARIFSVVKQLNHWLHH